MPPNTINLRSKTHADEILILRTVHNIEPISRYVDPRDGEKFLIFENDETTSDILTIVREIEEYNDVFFDEGHDVVRAYLLGWASLGYYDEPPKLKVSK